MGIEGDAPDGFQWGMTMQSGNEAKSYLGDLMVRHPKMSPVIWF